MKPSHIAEALFHLIPIKQPIFIWGQPGIGKSMAIRQSAQKLNLPVVDIRAVLLDPVDLRGLPAINGDHKAHWCPPAFLPYDKDSEGVLFLDELNAAPPLVQAACYQLVLDRALGEYRLPDKWVVIAAGNRESDRAVVHRMPSALANRFVHLDFETDLNDWVSWAIENNIKTEIIAFLRFRPALLHSFDPQKNDKAFPTPRSWEFVSNILSKKPAPELEFELVKGTVGEGAAAELVGFLKIFRQLPNPDAIMMNPTGTHVPTDPATLYALCGALARKASQQTIGRLMEYFNRLPTEFAVLAVRDSYNISPDIVNTRPYIEWTAKNSDVLI